MGYNLSKRNNTLEGKIALVTGASRGIGAAISLELAKLGAHVILTSRSVGGLEEVDDSIRSFGGSATISPLDLLDIEKIDHLGALVFDRYKKLDILVGNAGLLGTLGPINHLDPKVWDETLNINLTANWRLIRSFDPLLRQSSAGRAVFITSTAGQLIRPYWGIYAVSKAALQMLVLTYAKEVEKTKIKVNLFNPGGTRTAMRAQAFPGEEPSAVKSPENVAKQIIPLTLEECEAMGEVIRAKN